MYDTLQIAAAPWLTMLVYTAQPGSPSHDALQLLASWAATQDSDERLAKHAADEPA